MKKFWLVACAALLCSQTPAYAQSARKIQQIEDYLNNIKSLEADFVQTASNGSSAEGKLFIAKPNKIRMEYAPPVSVLIVGDGNYIVYNDKELDQVTNIDYDDIPATMILGNNLKIDNKNIKITDYYEDAGTTSVTLDYANKGDVGPITLIFSNDPFELKQWRIIDPQSVEVAVSLYGTQKDAGLDASMFKFRKEKNSPLNYKKRR